MAKSTSETGHYKNVANLQKLALYVQSLPKYNPARESLKVDNLLRQYNETDSIMEELKAAETAEARTSAERYTPFLQLTSFSTRVVAELESAVPDTNLAGLARGLLAKIRGTRIGKEQEAPEEHTATGPEEGQAPETGKQKSVSQRSYDALIDHFDKLIDVLEAEPNYRTNQPDLDLKALHTKLDQLSALNTAALQAANRANSRRNERQVALYTPVSGLVPTAMAVKGAVLSAYKAASPEYKKAASIAFRTLVKK